MKKLRYLSMILAEEDLLALLDIAIGAYDELEAEYGILNVLDDAA